MVLSSLPEDVEIGRKVNEAPLFLSQDQRDGEFPATELTLQSNRELDELVHPSQHGHHHSPPEEESKTTSAVFRSLYLKAAQVFPHGAGQAADVPLPPHQEVSYHSIVSHQESVHSSLDPFNVPPAAGSSVL